jgi:hypothetical protein
MSKIRINPKHAAWRRAVSRGVAWRRVASRGVAWRRVASRGVVRQWFIVSVNRPFNTRSRGLHLKFFFHCYKTAKLTSGLPESPGQAEPSRWLPENDLTQILPQPDWTRHPSNLWPSTIWKLVTFLQVLPDWQKNFPKWNGIESWTFLLLVDSSAHRDRYIQNARCIVFKRFFAKTREKLALWLKLLHSYICTYKQKKNQNNGFK